MPPYKEIGVALRLALMAVVVCSQPFPSFAEDLRNAENAAINAPRPPYPAQAMQAHEQGDVLLRVEVDNGKVINVTVISGPPTIAVPAAKWIKANWKFKPGNTGVFNLPLRFRYQGSSDEPFLYCPPPPYPPEAKKKKEEGTVLLQIVVKNGVITEVNLKSGPDDFGQFAAAWIKEKWKPKPRLTQRYNLPINFSNPTGKPLENSAVLRIVVKNGVMVQVTPLTGSRQIGAAAADFVKKNWEFSPEQSGTFTLPVVVQLPTPSGQRN